jgi:hypothetical protein
MINLLPIPNACRGIFHAVIKTSLMNYYILDRKPNMPNPPRQATNPNAVSDVPDLNFRG